MSTPLGGDWSDGALRLGDEQRFSVLTLDTDGSAIKTERFLWTLPRLLQIEQNGDPVNAATPAMRPPGFTVAATQQALVIQQRLERQNELEADFDNGSTPELHTEDVDARLSHRGVGRRGQALGIAAPTADPRHGRGLRRGVRRPAGRGLHPGHRRA